MPLLQLLSPAIFSPLVHPREHLHHLIDYTAARDKITRLTQITGYPALHFHLRLFSSFPSFVNGCLSFVDQGVLCTYPDREADTVFWAGDRGLFFVGGSRKGCDRTIRYVPCSTT